MINEEEREVLKTLVEIGGLFTPAKVPGKEKDLHRLIVRGLVQEVPVIENDPEDHHRYYTFYRASALGIDLIENPGNASIVYHQS